MFQSHHALQQTRFWRQFYDTPTTDPTGTHTPTHCTQPAADFWNVSGENLFRPFFPCCNTNDRFICFPETQKTSTRKKCSRNGWNVIILGPSSAPVAHLLTSGPRPAVPMAGILERGHVIYGYWTTVWVTSQKGSTSPDKFPHIFSCWLKWTWCAVYRRPTRRFLVKSFSLPKEFPPGIFRIFHSLRPPNENVENVQISAVSF